MELKKSQKQSSPATSSKKDTNMRFRIVDYALSANSDAISLFQIIHQKINQL